MCYILCDIILDLEKFRNGLAKYRNLCLFFFSSFCNIMKQTNFHVKRENKKL